MMNNRNWLNEIIHGENLRLKKTNDPFLETGYMGSSIALFSLYRVTKDKIFAKMAETYLDLMRLAVSDKVALEINNGLTGVGLDMEIFNILDIQTAVDLGCGPGWYVEDLLQHGINAFGIDGNPNIYSQASIYPCAKIKCFEYDLTLPTHNFPKTDCVICIEVCEHIPSEKEFMLIRNILSFESRLIIISWTHPGQKGDGHVNCKEQEYVRSLFESYNYKLNHKFTSFLRCKSKLWWIKNNILVFINSG